MYLSAVLLESTVSGREFFQGDSRSERKNMATRGDAGPHPYSEFSQDVIAGGALPQSVLTADLPILGIFNHVTIRRGPIGNHASSRLVSAPLTAELPFINHHIYHIVRVPVETIRFHK